VFDSSCVWRISEFSCRPVGRCFRCPMIVCLSPPTCLMLKILARYITHMPCIALCVHYRVISGMPATVKVVFYRVQKRYSNMWQDSHVCTVLKAIFHVNPGWRFLSWLLLWPRGFEVRSFTGSMPFLTSSQQRQTTEGRTTKLITTVTEMHLLCMQYLSCSLPCKFYGEHNCIIKLYYYRLP